MKIYLIRNKVTKKLVSRKRGETDIITDKVIYTKRSAKWRCTYLRLSFLEYQIEEYDLTLITPTIL